jgi:Ca-activated chloride channel family protein
MSESRRGAKGACRTNRDIIRFAGALLACAALASAGRSGAAAEQPAYRSGIELVPLTVTVTNRAGEHVEGLTGTDFTVLEDGVPQSLAFFAAGTVPIDLVLVLDTSASMSRDLPLAKSAAKGLVQTLKEGDRVAVLAVSESVAMPQGFTGDRHAISTAIDAAPAQGSTAVYDGVYIALKELARERRHDTEVRRQVLVLLSDGVDNASHVSADDVADTARRVGASIYVIALSRDSESLRGSGSDRRHARAAFEMQALANDSGGRLFQPTSARELPQIYSAIAGELASQYDLAYVPADQVGDGSFRRVAVRVSAAIRAVARTRSGYYAVSR